MHFEAPGSEDKHHMFYSVGSYRVGCASINAGTIFSLDFVKPCQGSQNNWGWRESLERNQSRPPLLKILLAWNVWFPSKQAASTGYLGEKTKTNRQTNKKHPNPQKNKKPTKKIKIKKFFAFDKVLNPFAVCCILDMAVCCVNQHGLRSWMQTSQ